MPDIAVLYMGMKSRGNKAFDSLEPISVFRGYYRCVTRLDFNGTYERHFLLMSYNEYS